mmetsp:Transcript_1928/g.4724  ORF Transcript_1928/g.4724 Transcript_1928/m.4724 type:complete len:216 (-) Transcript_1928:51-698(-)
MRLRAERQGAPLGHRAVRRLLGQLVPSLQAARARRLLPDRHAARGLHERWRRRHLPAARRLALQLGLRPDRRGQLPLLLPLHRALAHHGAPSAARTRASLRGRAALPKQRARVHGVAARRVAPRARARARAQGADPLHGAVHRGLLAPHGRHARHQQPHHRALPRATHRRRARHRRRAAAAHLCGHAVVHALRPPCRGGLHTHHAGLAALRLTCA